MATGPRSTIGLDTSAAYWEMRKSWPDKPQIYAATDRRLQTVEVHRTTKLALSDVWTPEPNLRVTSPARALLDHAPNQPHKRLVWLISNLRIRGLASTNQLASVASRNPRHPGSQPLLSAIGAQQTEPFRSPFEVDWPPFASKYQLPAYAMNFFINGHRVDILFLPLLLVVELDGWDTHQGKQAFEADRVETAELLAELRVPTVRITYDQFHGTPDRAARWISKALVHRQAA